MAIYCCPKCGSWNSCATKWVRTEKGDDNLCCNICSSYSECLRKDIDSILEDRSSKINWLRKELNGIMTPQLNNDYVYGLNQRDFKVFVANYALTGFWILYGLETKMLVKDIFYTLAIIPVLVIFWIILRKIQTVVSNKA